MAGQDNWRGWAEGRLGGAAGRAAVRALSALVLAATAATAVNITGGPTGLSGVTQANPGTELVIYAVRLQRTPPPQERLLHVRVDIQDLAAPTGLVAADFTSLRLFEDSPGATSDAWDLGDNAIATSAVVGGDLAAGVEIALDASGAGASILPGGGRWYYVTARIAPTATVGHSFRLAVLANNIDIDLNPPGPGGFDGITDVTVGGAIAASDNDRVEIVIAGPPPVPPASTAALVDGDTLAFDERTAAKPIPFGGEVAFGLAALLWGGYAMVRRRRPATRPGSPDDRDSRAEASDLRTKT